MNFYGLLSSFADRAQIPILKSNGLQFPRVRPPLSCCPRPKCPSSFLGLPFPRRAGPSPACVRTRPQRAAAGRSARWRTTARSRVASRPVRPPPRRRRDPPVHRRGVVAIPPSTAAASPRSPRPPPRRRRDSPRNVRVRRCVFSLRTSIWFTARSRTRAIPCARVPFALKARASFVSTSSTKLLPRARSILTRWNVSFWELTKRCSVPFEDVQSTKCCTAHCFPPGAATDHAPLPRHRWSTTTTRCRSVGACGMVILRGGSRRRRGITCRQRSCLVLRRGSFSTTKIVSGSARVAAAPRLFFHDEDRSGSARVAAASRLFFHADRGEKQHV